MDDKQLDKSLKNIEKTLGKENYAKISGDIGIIITGNSQNLKEINSRDEKIEDLKKTNEQLIESNSNLLKQIPMSSDEEDNKYRNLKEEQDYKPYNMRDAFDEYGNLKR